MCSFCFARQPGAVCLCSAQHLTSDSSLPILKQKQKQNITGKKGRLYKGMDTKNRMTAVRGEDWMKEGEVMDQPKNTLHNQPRQATVC